jgi:hypothetical protein
MATRDACPCCCERVQDAERAKAVVCRHCGKTRSQHQRPASRRAFNHEFCYRFDPRMSEDARWSKFAPMPDPIPSTLKSEET